MSWLALRFLLCFTFASCMKAQIDYAAALRKSILFYEAQRSGKLPTGHRIDWRADSQLQDGTAVGLDLSGGWYDAGDHVKFSFPMAQSVSMLAWGLIEFKDAYERIGELNNMYSSLRVPLEYFVKCHPNDNEFFGQVADGHADHAEWNRAENISMPRPSFKIDTNFPGSDLAGEAAAALAAGSIAFRESNSTFAEMLLNHSRSLFDFAITYQGVYSFPGQDFYGSSGFEDEICWAAAWLYRATNDTYFLQNAVDYYSDDVPGGFGWDNKYAGAQMMMYIITGDPQYSADVQAFLNSWRPGGDISYTPGGLAWSDMWGPLRYTGNTAAISLVAALYGIDAEASISWVQTQMEYIFGANPMNISYMIQESELGPSPRSPHHRSASCNPDHSIPCDWDDFNTAEDNDSELVGALVGGPDLNDTYVDNREDYVQNEVACDYNAGFQTALAGMVYFE